MPPYDADPDEASLEAVNAQLMQATEAGSVMNARYLLEEGGANVECRDRYGDTPLCLASHGGNSGMVRFLSEAGADVDGEDDEGCTPVFAAILNGQMEVARILVEERGADANKVANDGKTPLHVSVLHNRLEFVKWLVTKVGADVHKVDNHGFTPLSLATRYDRTAVASFLQNWSLSVLPRRAVLVSVNLARRQKPRLELLRFLAAAPDDIVRNIIEFV